MKKQGFTLVELLAVIIILAIILAIAVPSITGIITRATREAFISDAKMVLKAVDYKLLENPNYNYELLDRDKVVTDLRIGNQNYYSLSIIKDEVGNPYITIVGQNKWEGLAACGTFHHMIVGSLEDCGVDIESPVITLLGDNPINIYINDEYIDPGATAIDNIDGDITENIVVESNVNVNVPGTYTITYTVSDRAENEAVPVTRTVNVIDNVNPVVTFNPNGNETYVKSHTTKVTISDDSELDNNSLKYLWSTSTDTPSEEDFNNTFNSGDDILTPSDETGSYYLWIIAKDEFGNTTIKESNLFNLDNIPPTLTVPDDDEIYPDDVSGYNLLAGVSANDNISEVIINIEGSLSTGLGEYVITYIAIDEAGNETTKTRKITVIHEPVLTYNWNRYSIKTTQETRYYWYIGMYVGSKITGGLPSHFRPSINEYTGEIVEYYKDDPGWLPLETNVGRTAVVRKSDNRVLRKGADGDYNLALRSSGVPAIYPDNIVSTTTETVKSRGNYLGVSKSTYSNAYPSNGIQGSYWYIYTGTTWD